MSGIGPSGRLSRQGHATPTKCVDGKNHRWKYIGTEEVGGATRITQKWCSKCGSYTEFYGRSRAKEDGKPYIQIPQVSK